MKNRSYVFVCLVVLLVSLGLGGQSWCQAAEPQCCEEFIEKHEVEHLVITCMDHRFRKIENKWIQEHCDDDADIIAWPGATRCLDPNDSAQEKKTLEAIAFAIKNHRVTVIHLIHHLDCGGYGGSARHNNEAEERQFHKGELVRSAKTIASRHPIGVMVRIYLATPTGVEELPK